MIKSASIHCKMSFILGIEVNLYSSNVTIRSISKREIYKVGQKNVTHPIDKGIMSRIFNFCKNFWKLELYKMVKKHEEAFNRGNKSSPKTLERMFYLLKSGE